MDRTTPHHDSPLQRLLSVDGRSLAACRIAVGLVILADWAVRLSEIEPFLSEQGMLSLEAWRQLRSGQWVWSLYSLSAAAWWTKALFGAQALFAILLVLGQWTRVVTIALWGLVLSLHVRNPFITNSGDALIRMMLFWGMFSPWGERWSLDARRRSQPPLIRAPVWPSCLLMLQVSLVYLVTGWVKLNEVWLGGDALQRVAALDFCIRPWGRAVADWSTMLSVASVATPWVELLLPLLLWSPWATARLRTFVVLAFLLFHLAIDAVLHVGMFSLAAQSAWLVFLPGSFWDRVLPWSKIAVDSQRTDNTTNTGWPRVIVSGICLAALLVVLSSNIDDLVRSRPGAPAVEPIVGVQAADPGRQREGLLWLAYRLADAAMLHQEWTMFRQPPIQDTWVVASGATDDGNRIDVLRAGAPVAADGSPATAHRLPSQHWRYYFRRLTFPAYRPYAERSAQYLLDSWNRRHPDSPVSQLRLLVYIETFGEEGYETQTLATVGEPKAELPAFNLDRALQQLDEFGKMP